MLTENEVVELACQWLASQGCFIEQKRLGTAKGDDIIAATPTGLRIHVECKGSKSPRSEADFSNHYMWKAAAGAIFNSVRAVEERIEGKLFAVAFPNVNGYRTLLKDLQPFTLRNKIYVLWLGRSGVIDVWPHDLTDYIQFIRDLKSV